MKKILLKTDQNHPAIKAYVEAMRKHTAQPKTTMIKRYKFLKTGYKSNSGNHEWRFGKWYEYDGDLKMCERGFHCSKGIYQAFSYVQGEILAEVEVKGEHISQDDKEVWQKMRVIRSWKWTKKDSVLFSIFAARLVLANFEKVFPNDNRVRKAIEAAEEYVKNPTEKNRLAAESAGSATYKKLDKWMLNHVKELKVLKEIK